MYVYILLEHQLDCTGEIMCTRVADVCADHDKAKEFKAIWERADEKCVLEDHTDPCRYSIEKHYVTE